VSDSLKQHQQIELEKGIIAMRRSAASKGIAQGRVVTKEDFDKHIKGVLAPQTKKGGKFDEGVVGGTTAVQGDEGNAQKWTKDNSMLGANLGDLFRSNLDEAVQKVLDNDKARRAESAKKFNKWLEDKRMDEEVQQQKKVATLWHIGCLFS